MRNPVPVVVLLACGMFTVAAAGAQTMYRCGSNYQDRPCALAQGQARQYVGDPNAEERLRQEQASREAERKKATCARLNSSMDNFRVRERAGGSQATLDRLNDERRNLRDKFGQAGC